MLEHPDLCPVQRGAGAELFLGEAGEAAAAQQVLPEARGNLIRSMPSLWRPHARNLTYSVICMTDSLSHMW